MAHLHFWCCNGSMTPVVQPCFFKARPCAQFRLQHHAREVSRRSIRPAHIMVQGRSKFQARASTSHAELPQPTAGRPSKLPRQPSLLQRLLSTLRNIAIAALMLFIGLSRPAPAHARTPVAPTNPVVTTVTHQSAVHGDDRLGSEALAESSSCQPQERRGAQDTGIQLAWLGGHEKSPDNWRRRIVERFRPKDKSAENVSAPVERRYIPEVEKRSGPKVDFTQSEVFDPNYAPGGPQWNETLVLPQTSHRPDLLASLTYTQFWQLIVEDRIAKVKFAEDNRSAWVTTKPNAPGGARTEKVGLAFDEDLYPLLISHNVEMEQERHNPQKNLIFGCAKLIFPIYGTSFVLGFYVKNSSQLDSVFGGADEDTGMHKVTNVKTTFKDIAGIDAVKEEIFEIVDFLKNPMKYDKLGARIPAGILLAGAPGTGKTLLAKAMAGEAGVPFYTMAGTAFKETFVGTGAARVREVFADARANSPCILFMDEFDAIGASRSDGNDSSSTMNQMLTEMDGFEDNTGVIVMAATNRPEILDDAVIRPGRFDRMISMPAPNAEGREAILKVHLRGKAVEDFDMSTFARATSGMTGADMMGLVNEAGVMAVRQGRNKISEADLFDAYAQERMQVAQMGKMDEKSDGDVPLLQRRVMATYEASRCLIALMTPNFDEVTKVSVCPGFRREAFTLMVPQEDAVESSVVTRAYMEAKMVFGMAGRAGEQLILGQANMTPHSATDIDMVNWLAREMVYRLGFNRRLGPIALTHTPKSYLAGNNVFHRTADIGTDIAAIAFTEIKELVLGAQAKAMYGLTLNYKQLELLVERLMDQRSMDKQQLKDFVKDTGVIPFPDPFTDGFRWDDNGHLVYPGMSPEEIAERAADEDDEEGNVAMYHPLNPYRVRNEIPNLGRVITGRANPFDLPDPSQMKE